LVGLALRPSPKVRSYLPPQFRQLRRPHPILRQHEQLTLLGPDMALEHLRGQVFITYRYSDFHQADDSWIYDPTTRRVRRFSAEEKSDSFMGTDETLNDLVRVHRPSALSELRP
jgi:Outer membrane lipoprotein-sorting protein